MFSLRTLPARASFIALTKSITAPSATRTLSLLTTHTQSTPLRPTHPRLNPFTLPSQRCYSAKTSADSLIEEIQDQYAVARDEFEISTEETEKQSIYAQADRDAAREELDKLKKMYEEALKGKDGEEIESRIGARIRELDHAVIALEESAVEH